MFVNTETLISLTRTPSEGMFTECKSEALKSKSITVAPPLPSVIVRRGDPDVVST